MTTLADDGYLVLERLLDATALAGVRAAVDAGTVRGPGGTTHVDLDGPAIEAVWTAPRLVEAVEEVLGPDPARGQLHLRAPQTGFGAQALHADFAGLPPAAPAIAVAIVALVDIEPDGGATRVVPGTHVWRKAPPRDSHDRRHPDEVRPALAAGDALVFNGHLWHSGTRNGSPRRRDALQVTWTRRTPADG